jgi:hypothetical protein
MSIAVAYDLSNSPIFTLTPRVENPYGPYVISRLPPFCSLFRALSPFRGEKFAKISLCATVYEISLSYHMVPFEFMQQGEHHLWVRLRPSAVRERSV